jgi:glycosyltransferase involved in cell wall biosynthesis
MSVNTAIFPGLLYRALRIPQVMWYSHSSTSTKLRIATTIVDKVVTSIENAFPISTPKIRYVGHGIDFGAVNLEDRKVQMSRSGLVYLGRIAKVKNLNNLLTELNRIDYRGQVDFIGPVTDQNYLRELKKISALGKYEISFKEEIPHSKVREELSKYQFCFSGTPNSVDKATLEATAAGCILVTEMKPSILLTGLGTAWEIMSIGSELKVGDQILAIDNLSQSKKNELRQIIMDQTIARNELSGTTNRILQEALEI